MQFLGEEPGDYVEIFVVMGGEPTRVNLGGLRRAAWGRRVGGDFEFVGAQHFCFTERRSSHRATAPQATALQHLLVRPTLLK